MPETIYQAIYVQGRGGLRRKRHRALCTGRSRRQYLSVHTAADLAAVAAELNTRPRPQLVNARSKASANACAAGVASCSFEPRFSLSRYLTTMRRCSRIRRPRLSRCRYTFTPAPSSTARTNPGLQQLRGAQAAERHDYLGPARERGRAELSIPLPIVVVVRGVVAALEPGYSSFVIAGENSAVIEAGEAPRHGVHFTGPSREDHTTQVTYRAPGWAASSACRWVTW